uniref:Apical junction component 1 homolog n=1 Tax=Tetraodon nigroviridis TaxID=99883 RepID=H3CH52_TETNG
MTRTYPPDILASTLYQGFSLNPQCEHSVSLHSSKQCDLKMIDKPEIINKRHCRSFDFIESLDDPQSLPIEYPYKSQDKPSHLTWSDSKKRTRSKSAPRIKTTLTPVPISVSPPEAKKMRDKPKTATEAKTPDTRENFTSNRAFLDDVHPIKLQPHPPLYVSDCFDESKPMKANVTPHVRCRVDIKPDASVLQHTSSSPTPTPSELYSGHYRPGYHCSTSMSSSPYQHLDVHRMVSPTVPYLTQEQRAYSNPNIPIPSFSRGYFQDDRSSLTSYGSTVTSQYDPRTRWVHTLPVRSYYTDHLSGEPFHSAYGRPYSTSEAGSYISQTPMSRSYYGEDLRFNPYHVSSSRLFYPKSYGSPEKHISGYSNHSSQLTPPRVRRELGLPPWYNSFEETSRLGAEAKNHSKSWDNILYSHHDREQMVPRGRSYENLFYQARHGATADVAPQPVILNLSSSPRRYAALSLSENSLERGSASPWKTPKGGRWYVTPEITITDNDLNAGHNQHQDVHSVSWDTPGGEKTPPPRVIHQQISNMADQSLEQLDELLADLVVDYKPPTSRKASEGLLDQLKQLIIEDDIKDGGSPRLENTQLLSSKSSPDTVKDPDSGCDALQRSAEECSPDHSTDDDDTMVCANKKCKRTENMFNACLYFKSCHSCYTFYCSRNCRRDDWENHKETCLYGRVNSVCRHILKYCRENSEIHKSFSRLAKAGYLSRGRGILFLGFANPETAVNFMQVGLESLLMSPTYLSLRELESVKDNLGEYCKELQLAGNEYDPNECFLLNVSVAVGELVPNRPPRVQAPTVRKYAKVSLASSSPDKKVLKKDSEMETLILTPPPGTPDIDKEGEEGRKAREVCFVNIQRELRTRGVFLRHEYPKIYSRLCEFVESNKRFTPTTIYPIDKRTGKQFMCMIMAASEPRTLDWLGTPHLLDDII